MVAVLLAVVMVPAVAWAITIEIGGPVYKGKCVPCHADIADTDNELYVFSHGKHITYACATCHPTFPHSPAGTSKPVMRDCWSCHGLTHGPQGVMANGDCEQCHRPGPVKLRPKSHIQGWEGKPHVEPSEKNLRTECAMCHTLEQCDQCHTAEGLKWVPPVPFVYDPKIECLACHGNANLTKEAEVGYKSYQVTGLSNSAHRDTACIECHTDFSYGKPIAPSRVWSINAGLACANCHDHDEQTAEWELSVHGVQIAEGNLESATCAGCHGGHDIPLLDTEAAQRAMQASAEKTCGTCHEEHWASYDDWYHGAAYKVGAADAPACWECHGSHTILPAEEPSSTVYAANVAATCASCHQHANAEEGFAEQTKAMIHGRPTVRDGNPIMKLLQVVRGGSS
jgi:hypothetical protein